MRSRDQVLSRAAAGAVLLLLGSRSTFAQYYPSATYQTPAPGYTPTGAYYSTATGLTGAALKTALNDIIDNMTSTTYSSAQDKLAVTDRAPADGSGINKVILVYSHGWVGTNNNTGYIVDATWDSGVTWNKEHTWPNSYGMDGAGEGYGDLFNLRPCQPQVNSTRDNNYFDNVTGALPSSPQLKAPEARYTVNGAWNPPDVDRGHLARSQFYMDVRFEGQADDGDAQNDNFQLVNASSGGAIDAAHSNMGELSVMLEWHYKHPVTNYERRRNQIIFDSYQFNRNPFIDHPEYVWTIFGSGNNNSRIYAGPSVNGDGSSATTVTKRVMKNFGSIPNSDVVITKLNANPTTYDLTATANVTAAADTFGPGQAFWENTLQRTISVGLNDSTTTTGLKTGTVTLDNTDLTTAAAGQGSADGNDVITVAAQVVDNRVITASTVAFGKVIVGATAASATNLSSPGDDNNWTRVIVKADAVAADGNGVSIPAGIERNFNGTLTDSLRNLEANFASVGPKSGSRSFVLASGENTLSGSQTLGGVNVSYTGTGVTHSEGSLSSGSNLDSTSVDFGYVPVGFLRTKNLSVYNRETNPGFTASLDIDSVTPGGSAAQFTTSLATTGGSPIAGGANNGYTVGNTGSTAGALNATWTLGVSDENIPGATSGTNLVVNATGRFISTGDFPVFGTLELLTGENWSTGPASIGSNITLTKTGPGMLNIDGAQTHGAFSTLLVSGGPLTISTDAGSAASSPLALNVNGAGSLVTLDSSQHLRSLNLVGGTTTVTGGSPKILTVGSLMLTTAKLNLVDNDMIVRNAAPGSWNDPNSIAGKVKAGRNGGAWNGTAGIVTSMTAASLPYQITTLAVAAASDVLGLGSGQTALWQGETVSELDTLIKYTYSGDANLSGFIDADDYFAIDAGYGHSNVGFFGGDFDYNGTVDFDDYFLIDASYSIGGPALGMPAGLGAMGGAVSAVPEPSSAFLLAAGALLGCRRRRR